MPELVDDVKSIVLDYSQGSQLACFEKCMYQGALNNLRFAKSLTLYEIACSPGLRASDWQGSGREPERARQEDILRVLKLFPNNRLCSLRYSSVLPFSAVCIDYLNQYQVSIKDIHVAGCDPLALIGGSRRSLTAYFGMEAKSHILFRFLRSLKPLESLTISLPGGWNELDNHYWDITLDPMAGNRVSTKSLTLPGCMPRSFGDKFQRMFDWSILTSLSFFEGNLWLVKDIMESQYEGPDLRNLVHFQCYTLDYIFEQDTLILYEFFKMTESLRHVLLSISGLTYLPVDTPERLDIEYTTRGHYFALWPLRNRLLTMVWHDAGQERPLDKKSLDCICRSFASLQELGFAAPQAFDAKADKESLWNEDLLEYLAPLSHVKTLRMVHLYQKFTESEDGDERFWPQHQTTANIQAFATLLFQWAHSYCPQFEVFVWGLYEEVKVVKGAQPWKSTGDASKFVPELFFMKKLLHGQNGAIQITASFTTRSRVRADFPELLLPKSDPGFDELARAAFGH
ncbi:hypothetical protein HBI25_178750 [Parastagonospora nodorum]|nr:hypothetical protein HBI70_005130 [Parastagonospora nodorum]KAH5552924.1 hypothetical protein HBI25_178750 [Parastagonospora nodorum]KAH6056280.1 hypothetical protein HBI54_004950 [Parastagonospora nodorum]KAH6314227.1 hypothetical protein HBI39_043890 [Parastagonospora nodorum]